MKCPKCKEDLHCPCFSCRITRQKPVVVWRWIDGEAIACPCCGYIDHADNWGEVEDG